MALLAVSSVSVFAASSSQSQLTVTATLQGSCTTLLNSTSSGTFGMGILTSSNDSLSVPFSINCTAGTTVNSVNIASGNTALGSGYALLNTTNGVDAIPYNLTSNDWTGVNGAPIPGATLTGISQTANLLGRAVTVDDNGTAVATLLNFSIPFISIPATANSGSYQDILTLTTNY